MADRLLDTKQHKGAEDAVLLLNKLSLAATFIRARNTPLIPRRNVVPCAAHAQEQPLPIDLSRTASFA
jgi:hypothetical protein